ncbi:MAG: site-specific integrase [Bacteroidales bacterium]
MTKSSDKQLFYEYFKDWVSLYKDGAVQTITLNKYHITQSVIRNLAPKLKLCDLSRKTYQKLLNDYALTHEKQTTMDFHHQVKGAIMDAIEDGLIHGNPTRKAIIKGRIKRNKKNKFLNQSEIQKLMSELELCPTLNWDWFILLIAKTGMRFAEALALTPNDFDFSNQQIIVNKSWNYKSSRGSFQPTKNFSSNRKIKIDWQTAMQFSQLIKDIDNTAPIFVKNRVFNSTVNNRLKALCVKANIPIITIHGLRHTHASLLLFANVSIASVASRLGHSSMSTTQETYLHIIQELENQDNEKIIQHLSMLM